MLEAIAATVGTTLAVGTVYSVLGKLKKKQSWSNKHYGGTLGVTFVSSSVAVFVLEGGVDSTNVLKVFFETAGINFVIFCGAAILTRLRGSK